MGRSPRLSWPQMNGPVERFWGILNDDWIDGTPFASLAVLQDDLEHSLLSDNEIRPHQVLGGTLPKHINESCQRMTEPRQG